MLHEVLYGVLYEVIHELCNNHDDDEIEVEDLRAHEGDSEILRHRHT